MSTTATQLAQTEPQWPSLSGRVLEGGYEVGELAEADETGAKFRIRVLGDRSTEAFAQVVRATGSTAEEQLAIWETARQLKHANLSSPLACGQVQIDGVNVIYAVLRRPDEILTAALAERALDEREAGEVLVSVAAALQALANNGLVHGCVSPEEIVAQGNSIQLTTAS